MRRHFDRVLFGLTAIFLIGGFFIFSSASLGLLARNGATFSDVAFSQIVYGIVGGTIALFLTSHVHYRFWRKYAFYFFVFGLILTLLVFVPGLGFEHGGARRWLSIAGFSFQPAEILKISFVIYLAALLSGLRQHMETLKKGTLPFLGVIGITGALLLMQPDTGTFLIMCGAGGAMFLTAGGRWRDILFMVCAGVTLLVILALMRPYVMDRITTFLDPSVDPQGTSYQVRQSLIAIGSGGVTGRGFGQSVQKFEYLPEPIGDSIFAVFSEEFGFIGSTLLVLLFALFAFRGYRVATRAPDLFGMLLIVGFVTLIVGQAFLNMAAMLALAPLSGLPLPLISHGGTALLATLAMVGIVLNVSKYQVLKK